MIIGYVWKCEDATGWTTAFWDRVKREYDIDHFEEEGQAIQWLRANAPGCQLLDVQEFLTILDKEL